MIPGLYYYLTDLICIFHFIIGSCSLLGKVLSVKPNFISTIVLYDSIHILGKFISWGMASYPNVQGVLKFMWFQGGAGWKESESEMGRYFIVVEIQWVVKGDLKYLEA